MFYICRVNNLKYIKMDTQDYLKLKEEKQFSINQIRKEIEDLKNNYIKEHKKFNLGEKVIISKGKKNERFAFIKNINVDMYGDIKYDCFKCKKDGTASMQSDYVYYSETIDKI